MWIDAYLYTTNFLIMSFVTKTKILKTLDHTTYFVNGKKHRLDGPAVDSPLVKEWWVNGKLHRVDGPARLMCGGSMCFYVDGRLHREDGPAIILTNGCQEWWLNGLRHRVDGPAYIYGVNQEWWLNGRLHRLDGPAVTNQDKTEWYEYGLLHRLDGPAVTYKYTQRNDWFINGIRYDNEQEHKQAILSLRADVSGMLYDSKKVCRDVANYISCFVI